jgi:hypothetical protein
MSVSEETDLARAVERMQHDTMLKRINLPSCEYSMFRVITAAHACCETTPGCKRRNWCNWRDGYRERAVRKHNVGNPRDAM